MSPHAEAIQKSIDRHIETARREGCNPAGHNAIVEAAQSIHDEIHEGFADTQQMIVALRGVVPVSGGGWIRDVVMGVPSAAGRVIAACAIIAAPVTILIVGVLAWGWMAGAFDADAAKQAVGALRGMQ